MSKTIKIIDLINAIANNDKKPYQVKYEGDIYTWDCLNHYVDRKDGTSLFYTVIDYKDFLNDTVEIIEEQEEIDIQHILELNGSASVPDCIVKINQIINAVQQIEKELKEE